MNRPHGQVDTKKAIHAANSPQDSFSKESDDHLGLPILSRIHEKALFAVYAVFGSVLLHWSPHKHFSEAAVALTWSTMILGISFTEAWVKFQAPFLLKSVAVDVGRHVFAAKQSIELGLCAAFWGSRSLMLRSSTSGKTGSILPAVATMGLLVDALIVSPKLYQRAKHKIVKELSNNGWMDSKAKQEMAILSQEINRKDFRLPSRVWHSVYGAIELLKVVCLDMFAYASLRTALG